MHEGTIDQELRGVSA